MNHTYLNQVTLITYQILIVTNIITNLAYQQRKKTCHLSTRSVRPEVYEIAHTLNAEYHMSRRQIEGSFVEISKLFGRNWKALEPNTTIDNDTLPAMTNMTRTRNYVEAMALNQIVEEIMESDGVAITY